MTKEEKEAEKKRKNSEKKNKKDAVKGNNSGMSATFSAFSIILTIAILCAIFFSDGIFKSTAVLIAFFMAMFAYYLLDTLAIVKGKYSGGKLDPEDYIYGSVKLFLDFVVMFTILMSFCKGDD